MQFIMSEEDKKIMISELASNLVPLLVEELEKRTSLPPVLTRRQFMKLMDIGEAKCAELFKRSDFPICREFGNPRVSTKLLFEWIEAHSGWVNENTGFYRAI